MRVSYSLVILGIALASAGLIHDAYGAGFIKFDGIDGESKDKDHKGWSDILSISENIATALGASQRTGTTSDEIIVLKNLDRAGPQLAESIATGKVFQTVLINLCESSGCYLYYELTNVMITSYTIGGSADEIPTEEISLNFEKISKGSQPQTKERAEATKSEEQKDDSTDDTDTKPKPRVPQWVQSTAKFWVDDNVSDREFTDALGFLVKEKIIEVEVEQQETTQTEPTSEEPQVPAWISQSTKWWINGEVPEDQFLEGIKWMIKNKIIRGI